MVLKSVTLKDLELHYRCFAVFGANEKATFPTPITLKRLKIVSRSTELRARTSSSAIDPAAVLPGNYCRGVGCRADCRPVTEAAEAVER